MPPTAPGHPKHPSWKAGVPLYRSKVGSSAGQFNLEGRNLPPFPLTAQEA